MKHFDVTATARRKLFGRSSLRRSQIFEICPCTQSTGEALGGKRRAVPCRMNPRGISRCIYICPGCREIRGRRGLVERRYIPRAESGPMSTSLFPPPRCHDFDNPEHLPLLCRGRVGKYVLIIVPGWSGKGCAQTTSLFVFRPLLINGLSREFIRL